MSDNPRDAILRSLAEELIDRPETMHWLTAEYIKILMALYPDLDWEYVREHELSIREGWRQL